MRVVTPVVTPAATVGVMRVETVDVKADARTAGVKFARVVTVPAARATAADAVGAVAGVVPGGIDQIALYRVKVKGTVKTRVKGRAKALASALTPKADRSRWKQLLHRE